MRTPIWTSILLIVFLASITYSLVAGPVPKPPTEEEAYRLVNNAQAELGDTLGTLERSWDEMSDEARRNSIKDLREAAGCALEAFRRLCNGEFAEACLGAEIAMAFCQLVEYRVMRERAGIAIESVNRTFPGWIGWKDCLFAIPLGVKENLSEAFKYYGYYRDEEFSDDRPWADWKNVNSSRIENLQLEEMYRHARDQLVLANNWAEDAEKTIRAEIDSQKKRVAFYLLVPGVLVDILKVSISLKRGKGLDTLTKLLLAPVATICLLVLVWIA